MSILNAIRAGIAVANKVTKPIQATVLHRAWVGSDDGYGSPLHTAPVSRLALVDQTLRMVRTASGELILTRASLTFVYPIPPHGAQGRVEPIDPRDIIILPDGTTGPIISAGGFTDAETGLGLMSDVWLGVAQ